MTIRDKQENLLKVLVEYMRSGCEGYFEAASFAAKLMPKRYHEQLYQLVEYGPVYDGHVISKYDRNFLFDIGLAVRVCVKGEQGYTGATYPAYTINKKIRENME